MTDKSVYQGIFRLGDYGFVAASTSEKREKKVNYHYSISRIITLKSAVVAL